MKDIDKQHTNEYLPHSHCKDASSLVKGSSIKNEVELKASDCKPLTKQSLNNPLNAFYK